MSGILLALTTCGGKNRDDVKAKFGYSTYTEAIEANDFEAAYKIISSSPNIDPFDYKAYYLQVLKSELSYLVSQNNEDYDNRILFLINENENFNDVCCNYVATLAANIDNDELVRKMAQQIKDKAAFFKNKTVAEYAKDKDYYIELRRKYLDERYKELMKGVDLPNLKLNGIVKSDHYGKLDSEYESYSYRVRQYNKECIDAIVEALDYGDRNLANKICRLVKKNIVIENLGDWSKVVEKNGGSSVYNAYKITEADTDIKEAKELLK